MPSRLRGEYYRRHGKELRWSGAVRKQADRDVWSIQQKVAKLVADAAGPHIFVDQRLVTGLLEMPAVRARKRAIFDELHRRRGIAHAKAVVRCRRNGPAPVHLCRFRRRGGGRDGEGDTDAQAESPSDHFSASSSCGWSLSHSAVFDSSLPLMTNDGVPSKSGN